MTKRITKRDLIHKQRTVVALHIRVAILTGINMNSAGGLPNETTRMLVDSVLKSVDELAALCAPAGTYPVLYVPAAPDGDKDA